MSNDKAVPAPLNIWVVDEGSPGHLSQSLGLVQVLGERVPVWSTTMQGRVSVRGWLRHLIRWWLGESGRALSDASLRRIAKLEMPVSADAPDLIVSSGGKSVFVGLSLSKRYSVPYVFVGERKPYPEAWFHTIVSPVPMESSDKTIDVELIPTPVASNADIRGGKVDVGVWCMVIGGASRSHRFSVRDWVALAEGMNRIAMRESIRWRMTTSRRTGYAAEAILRKHLNPSVIEDAIWWSEAPRRELYKFMAASEVLFVTQDSVTMVTEAVSAYRPVVVVQPAKTVFTNDSFLPEYFARLERNQRIQRVCTERLGEVTVTTNAFHLLEMDPMVPVAEALLRRLALELS